MAGTEACPTGFFYGFESKLRSESNYWQPQAKARARTGETPVPPFEGELL